MKTYVILLLISGLVLSGCAPKRTENFYFGKYSEAEKLYNAGQYEKAIEKYQTYREENPEGNLAVMAQYYIAKSYQALGKTDEAKKIFEEIKKNYPELPWANFSETQLKEMNEAPKQ